MKDYLLLIIVSTILNSSTALLFYIRHFKTIAFLFIFSFQQKSKQDCKQSKAREDNHRDGIVIGRYFNTIQDTCSCDTKSVKNPADKKRDKRKADILHKEYHSICCTQLFFRNNLRNRWPHC